MSRECPECFFSPYVEGKPHAYGGRESAKMLCYGPKHRVSVNRTVPPKRPPVTDTPLPCVEPSTIPVRPVRTTAVPGRADKGPKPVKLTKAERALQELAIKLGLRPASALLPPPTSAGTVSTSASDDPVPRQPLPAAGASGRRRRRTA